MRTLRFNFPTHCTGLVTGRSRDDEAAGKHLSLRKHRAGQRIEASVPAHGTRYLGSDWGGLHEAVRIPPFLSGLDWEAVHSVTPFISHGKQRGGFSGRGSSAGEIVPPCPTTSLPL